MGNPNHLISWLPPKVRESIQAEMDLKAVRDLLGVPVQTATSIEGVEIDIEAGKVILTGKRARDMLFQIVDEKRAEAAHAISKTIALFNVYWTGKGNEERSRAAEKVEEVKRLLNDLVSLADLARELRSSAQFGGTCDEAKEGCPHCPEASQSSQKPRDLQKDTDQGLTDRRS